MAELLSKKELIDIIHKNSPVIYSEDEETLADAILTHKPAPEKTCPDTERLNWLDLHASFVADGEYIIGPYKVGELRKMADDGIAIDKSVKQKDTRTCICMDCGEIIKVNEQSKHEKECPMIISLSDSFILAKKILPKLMAKIARYKQEKAEDEIEKEVPSEFPAEIKDIGIDLVDEFFPKGVCKERGQAIVLYAQLIIRFQKLMTERNKSVEQMTNYYYETLEEYKTNEGKLEAEIARLKETLAEERNENNVLRKNNTSFIKEMDKLRAEIAQLKAEREALCKTFYKDICSTNQFYFPKPICKNKLPEISHHTNACLSCQIIDTCRQIKDITTKTLYVELNNFYPLGCAAEEADGNDLTNELSGGD